MKIIMFYKDFKTEIHGWVNFFWNVNSFFKSWVSSVQQLDYRLDDWRIRVQSEAEARDFSLLQTGSGAHSASNTVDTRDCFPGGKAAGMRSGPLTSI
jgi:hypothetical protein